MGYFSQLTPIEKAGKFKEFGIIDIEAQSWVDFVCIGLYTTNRGFDVFDYKDGWEEFFEYLFDPDVAIDDPEFIKIYFAHFAGKYDFLFLLDFLVKQDRFEFVSGIPRGSSILSFTVEEPKTGKKISFWDSSALLPFSLKTLTNNFGVEALKGKIDYNFIRQAYDNIDFASELIRRKNEFTVKYNDNFITKLPRNYKKENITYYLKEDINLNPKMEELSIHKIYNRSDLLGYLKNDCKGLHQVLSKFYSWPLIQKSGQAFTIASQAMKIFRTFLNQTIYSISEDRDEFIRKSYFGGRTEIFKPAYKSIKLDKNGLPIKGLYCYDVNSLFPYCMWKFDFPTKWLCNTDKLDMKHIGFYHAQVYVPPMHIPPLPMKHEGKLIFPIGTFDGYWSGAELKMALQYGVKIKKIYKGHLYESGGRIFKDYVEALYDIRIKNGPGTVNNILAKLILNSSYGKFGISNLKEQIVWETGEGNERIFMKVKIGKNNYALVSKEIELEGFSHVGIAAMVTSYARTVMYPLYRQCEKALYYTDTDSMYTTKKFKESKELGGLKLEEADDEAIFLLPKTYITNTKLKMKGFEKKTLKFDFDDFQNALQGELAMMKYTMKERPMTFKTAIRRRGKILALAPEAEKAIRSHYTKRIVIKAPDIRNWTTRPIKLEIEEPKRYNKGRKV